MTVIDGQQPGGDAGEGGDGRWASNVSVYYVRWYEVPVGTLYVKVCNLQTYSTLGRVSPTVQSMCRFHPSGTCFQGLTRYNYSTVQ